jgi:hypothetical protein
MNWPTAPPPPSGSHLRQAPSSWARILPWVSGFALLQLGYSGHRLHYIRTLAEACDPGVVPRLLTTREAVASREFDVHLGELTSRRVLDVSVVGSSKEPMRRLVANALRLSVESGVLRIVVPEADRLLVWLLCASIRYRRSQLPEMRLVMMRTPEPGMWMRRNDAVAYAKIGLSLILRRWWPHTNSYFLTDAFGVVTTRRGYRGMQPIRDPAGRLPLTDRVDARSELGLAGDSYVLGLIGAVGISKHPQLTLEALAYLPPRVVVLLAGRTDAPTAAAVVEAQSAPATAGRVFWKNGYLTDAHLGQCISACDALMLLYELDAPSGMLATAIYGGIPIVAGGSRWVTRVVEHLEAGVTTQLDCEGVVRAVETLMSASARPVHRWTEREAGDGEFSRTLLGA